MKFHYQALLFTLCVVVMTACGAPAATSTAETAPSATPAPEWQTYTNADAGFSIRYPPTWKAEALPDVNNGALHALSITGPEAARSCTGASASEAPARMGGRPSRSPRASCRRVT